VRLRTALEGKPTRQRSLAEYKHVLGAFEQVINSSPKNWAAPESLLAMAEIYQAMGRELNSKYFDSAIETYRRILKEYPGVRYGVDLLYTVGQIQRSDLGDLQAARETFHDLIQRYPKSGRARAAKRVLADIAEEEKILAETFAPQAEPSKKLPQVVNVRHWNARNYTRVVIDVEDEVKYQEARIANPDRIFFDLYNCRLASSLAGKTFDLENGLLKNMRIAHNQVGVVRVVLEVVEAEHYSVFSLPNPFRLVVDIYGKGEAARVAAMRKPSPKADALPGSPPSPAKGTETAKLPQPIRPAEPNADGTRSLTRTLGLKIGRIVIDPGHGGHDTGTVGPTGLMEKDLVLDVGRRLARLLQKKSGVEVILTRDDDTFVPLENRTALANQSQADLFISLHANSSPDQDARGVETYYLNFTDSRDALEVAARENAVSQKSIFELQDLVKKIAVNEKREESKELAQTLQTAMLGSLVKSSRRARNRGVKHAPFVVLIGANMPSVLAEISFLSNRTDEKLLKEPVYRQKVAAALHGGLTQYFASLSNQNGTRQLPSVAQASPK
jgi:N-acetylmuramoyl-L-alanine amidase